MSVNRVKSSHRAFQAHNAATIQREAGMSPNPWNDGENYEPELYDKPHLPAGLVWYALGAIALCVIALFVL